MTPGGLASLVALNLMGVAAPGPDTLLVMRAATRSRRHAYATVAGVHVGVLLWMTLTVCGAAAVLGRYPILIGVIQLAGGAYLGWMGARMARAGWRLRGYSAAQAPGTTTASAWQCARQGFGTNLSNPKIVLFLTAIIAPVMPAETSWGAAAVIVACLWLSSAAYFLLIATVLSTAAVQRRALRASPAIDVVAGAVFVLFGVALVLRGAAEVVG
ncbi:LysE family transporter [Corynebacterium sp. zg-331]|uniref:LysE family transporter n=1 Tax=unclassified Corynebacterium TaxID=2624378 RepID=UPI00128B9D48|nr:MULTISPECIES: LysE family transporter [unclassified Corynebacterium]MBC3185077.1 LysE family transporter [Corynebacterium sp. zg-331]MPV51577.1 LysE family translocator [Corynebacterium sp. zg331]